MSEVNLFFHYQMVKHNTKDGEEYTVHEAFSEGAIDGPIYMLSPIPVLYLFAGESKEEIAETISMIDTDIEKFGVVELKDMLHQIERFSDNSAMSMSSSDNTLKFEDEEAVTEDDFYDSSGKVLDLVDYMNNTGKRKK